MTVSAPMSFSGSAARLWRLTGSDNLVVKYISVPLVVALVLCVWAVVAAWYVVSIGLFGVFFFLFRLWRRTSRMKRSAK